MKNYRGHKRIDGVYQKIINHIPKHTYYMELFAGSAAIYSLLSVPDDKVLLNDIDLEVQSKLALRYPQAKVTNECAISILQSNQTVLAKDAFIFLDPPYKHSTRPNSVDIYNFEMSDSDHVQLLTAVLQMTCNVMIIHPKCELYDTYLKLQLMMKWSFNHLFTINLRLDIQSPQTMIG